MIVITIHPLLASLQRHRVPSWLAVVLTMLVAYASLLVLAAALVLSAARLATLLPSYQPQFASLVDQFTGWLGEMGVTQEQINSVISQFDLGSLVGVLQRVLSGATSVVSDLTFVLVLLQGGIRQAVLVIVAYSVINVAIQSLVQPKFVGDAVGLSVTLTFLSLVFWSYVIGPPGALLAVPLSLFVNALLVDADPASRWLVPLIDPGSEDRSRGKGRGEMKEFVVLGFDNRELAEEARSPGTELDREGVLQLDGAAPACPRVLHTTLDPAAEQRLLAAFTGSDGEQGSPGRFGYPNRIASPPPR